jgi:ABC-type cobalamin/Fe3+-siderophores transport system ATPase subunit
MSHLLLFPPNSAFSLRNEVKVPDDLRRQLDTQIHQVAAKTHTELLVSQTQERLSSVQEDPTVKEFKQILESLQSAPPNFSLRVKNGSYKITNYYDYDPDKVVVDGKRVKQKIATVRTESVLYKLKKLVTKCFKGELKPYKKESIILDQINLSLEPGKMYLVLGAPGSGKSSLLKLISQTLFTSRDHNVGGEVSVAGVTPGKDVHWSNIVSYIDQIDRIHPYMTVHEVCEFSWRCATGSTHRRAYHGEGNEVDAVIAKMDQEMLIVNRVLDVLGLTRVKDTFVGDQSTVRGVSGGEKKRVTLAEMLVVSNVGPVLEIFMSDELHIFVNKDNSLSPINFRPPVQSCAVTKLVQAWMPLLPLISPV